MAACLDVLARAERGQFPRLAGRRPAEDVAAVRRLDAQHIMAEPGHLPLVEHRERSRVERQLEPQPARRVGDPHAHLVLFRFRVGGQLVQEHLLPVPGGGRPDPSVVAQPGGGIGVARVY